METLVCGVMLMFSPLMTSPNIHPAYNASCFYQTQDTPVVSQIFAWQELKIADETYIMVPMQEVVLSQHQDLIYFGNYRKDDDKTIHNFLAAGIMTHVEFRFGPPYFWEGLTLPPDVDQSDWFGLYIQRGEQSKFFEFYFAVPKSTSQGPS